MIETNSGSQSLRAASDAAGAEGSSAQPESPKHKGSG